MDVCILMLVKIPKRLDHHARLLRCCGAIKINQRITVDLLVQNREIFAKSRPIDGLSGKLVHTTICYTRAYAPVYSTKLKRVTRVTMLRRNAALSFVTM